MIERYINEMIIRLDFSRLYSFELSVGKKTEFRRISFGGYLPINVDGKKVSVRQESVNNFHSTKSTK